MNKDGGNLDRQNAYGEEKIRKIILVTLMAFAILATVSPVTSDSSQSTITYYDGKWITSWLHGEKTTYDVPTVGVACVDPGPYPYEFNLTEPLHVHLQIRHALWRSEPGGENNLTIYLDGAPVLEADTIGLAWYPGGPGIELIDLGTVPAGTHYITMSANHSDYYAMDWFKVLELVEIHDVAVIDVTATSFQVDVGEPVTIIVDIANEGGFSETVNVTVSYDTTIDTKTVTLAVAESKTEQFTWDTTGVPLGRYTITVEASVAVDDDPYDNTVTTEWGIDIVPEFPTLIPLLLTLAILAASTIILRKKLR